MSGSIGQTPQIQPNVIQQNAQQNAQRSVNRDAQQGSSNNSSREVAQAQSNQNFQQLAQDIIASRAEAPVSGGNAAPQRGQVLDILV